MIRALFIVLAVFLWATAGAAAKDKAHVSEKRIGDAVWLASEADAVAFLLNSPGECLRAPASNDERYFVEVGRAAFRSPLLLGGQAARGGLSCNSCHRDGRDNPAFFLKGLSDEPGTADVTSSLFSKTRDDGVLNPRPIPSLVDAGAKQSFGEMAPAPSLHAFITSAVIDEFQGAEPPEAVISGLAAYVAHLASDACPPTPTQSTAQHDVEAVDRALAAAEAALKRNDRDAADFLLLAAQQELGRVFERFAPHRKAQAKIESLSREIGMLRAGVNEDARMALAEIAEKRAEAQNLATFLHKRRAKSLYDAKTLGRWLAPR